MTYFAGGRCREVTRKISNGDPWAGTEEHKCYLHLFVYKNKLSVLTFSEILQEWSKSRAAVRPKVARHVAARTGRSIFLSLHQQNWPLAFASITDAGSQDQRQTFNNTYLRSKNDPCLRSYKQLSLCFRTEILRPLTPDAQSVHTNLISQQYNYL